MRIVKLSNLSENERKRVLEQQNTQLDNNQKFKQQVEQNANQRFEELYKKKKNKPSTIGSIEKAYKGLPQYNTVRQSLDRKYKENHNSLWNNVMNVMGNFGYGLANGVIGIQQQFKRQMDNGIDDRINFTDKINQKYAPNKKTYDENMKQILGENYNKPITDIDEKIKKQKEINNQNIQRNIDNTTGGFAKKIAEITPSIGQMAPGMFSGMGAVYMAGVASNNYYEDAKQRGMNEEQAKVYSSIMGLAEGGTELIGIGNLKKAGKGIKDIISHTGKTAVKETAKDITKTSIKTVLKDYGVGIADNMLQETIIDPIQELMAQAVGGKDKANWENMGQRMLEDGINGGLVSAILGGANIGLQSCTGVVQKIKSRQQITENEFKTAVKEAGTHVDVNKMIQDSTEQQINKYRDYSTGKKVDLNTQKWMENAQEIVNKNANIKKDTNNNIKQLEEKEKNKFVKNNKVQIENDTVKYENKQEENIYFRFDEKSGFKGKEHQSAVSMWEERVDEKLEPKYEYYDNSEDAENAINEVLKPYNINYEEYDNLSETEKQKIKRKMGLDEGLITDGASSFRLDEDGIKELISYIKSGHPINEYEEINFFTGNKNGFGADGEFIIKPNEIIHTDESKNIMNILDNDNLNYKEKLNSIVDIINNNINERQQEYDLKKEDNTTNKQTQLSNLNQSKDATKNNLKNDKNISYKYEKSDNKKIDSFRQDMSKYWNNSEETKSLGNVIEKVIGDKNYNVRLDDNMKNNKGQTVNAQIKMLDNGETEIKINPNSKNIGEFLLAHEITHTIETKEIKQLIVEHAMKDSNFNAKLDSLKQTYGVDDVSSEVVADISGQLLGNQEFINNLSMNKPNIFKRIYNKIVDLANKITGNTNESLFLKDLKNKWEEAYRTQNNNLKSNIKYHVSENFENEIDMALRNKLPSNTQVKARDFTPKILVDNGVKDLPMLITQNHIKSIIYSEQEAKNFKLPIKNTNYHGLGKELLIKAIDNLDNPSAVYKTSEKNYLVVTEFLDSNKKEIIVPIQIDGKGKYNNVFINENQIKSVYGRANLENYLKKNNFELIYKKNEELDFNEGIQYSNVANSSINNSILLTKENVNNTKKYSMQETDNNSYIRYFRNNETWQSYLNKRYKATGTRTNLEDIRLPISNKSKIDMTSNNLITTKWLDDHKLDYEIDQNNQLNIKDKEEVFRILNETYNKTQNTAILPTKQSSDGTGKIASILENVYRDKLSWRDSFEMLGQKLVNKGLYVDKLAEKTNNPELKFAFDRALNSQAEGQYVVGVAQTDNNGNKIGKSINEMWKPVENSKLIKEFSEYLLHKHNIDRSQRNKYVFGKQINQIDSAKIASDLMKTHPEFKEWEKEIKQFNNNNLNNLKEAGLLTQDTIDYLNTIYPNYVSIARAIEGNLYGKIDNAGVGAPIKKATGGNSDIQPLKEAMAEQVIRVKRLINENRIGLELSKSMKTSIIKDDSDIEFTPELLMTTDTLIDEDKIAGKKYYTFFERGKLKKIEINDNLYESLKKSEKYALENSILLKGVQKVSNVHRSLLTSDNPIFVITNFFKDFQDGMFNSKYSKKFVKNYGKALSEIHTKGKYYESYMANGGMTNTYFDYEKGTKNKNNKIVDKIRNINEIVEQTPRLAEFISTLEAGKSLNEALYNAAEITTNFKRGGDIVKALNRNGAEFLNASVQGFDKQFRNLTGQNGVKGYINILAKATILGVLPSVINHLLLDDDEDYKDLPQSTKDLYYLFKSSDGKFIRIPKGRALSIFGAIARRTLEGVQGQDDAWEGFTDTVVNQIAANNPLEDNIFSPITSVVSNKTWYGGDLESSRLQKELPKNRYDETTDEFSKWLGSKINVSPKKINYLLDQYSGGVGDVLLPVITPQAKENVFIDKFTTDSVLKNKNVTKFFDTLDKQTQVANDFFATDKDKIQLKYLNDKLKEVNELYKEKREVQMSNISKEEKKIQVREIQSEINNIVEKALKEYQKNSTEGKLLKVGDSEYYKDKEGKMQELSEDTKQKIGDMKADTYLDYQEKIKSLKDKKVKNGEITNKQNIKTRDKIQILLDSKYTDKEKKKIYENYIKSEQDNQYEVMKSIGIGIDEYLKYKQQEFESDKEDDRTIEGKTISNSKKKKVYEYVNSMNINYEQKLILLGTQYSLTSKEKSKLAKYINELPNQSKKEKLEMYGKMKGFTVYKNGKVEW